MRTAHAQRSPRISEHDQQANDAGGKACAAKKEDETKRIQWLRDCYEELLPRQAKGETKKGMNNRKNGAALILTIEQRDSIVVIQVEFDC